MTNQIPIKKNEQYEIEFTDLSVDAAAIGKINGFTVFVPGGLPGERAKVLIVKVKKTYAYGKILELLKPSCNRTVPLCPIYEKCGGCQLQHIAYEEQLQIKTKKVQDCIDRIGGFSDVIVPLAMGTDHRTHYRNKAQFPVGRINGKTVIGFYAFHSHRIIDTKTCLIQHPVNDLILQAMREYIAESGISVYDEQTHQGLLRHILTKVGFETGDVMVCLVVNGTKIPKKDLLIEKLCKIPGLTGIVLNTNCEKTNVILGRKQKILWGQGFITDFIGEIKYQISPLSFFQVNPYQTKLLYEKALEFSGVTKEMSVLDIYCGIGTISLFFAPHVKKVFGVEIVEEAIEDAKRNAEINGIENVSFVAGAAEKVIPKLYQEGFCADVVVVDPPRKGCDIAVLNTIKEMMPARVVYVSCDPATLARDMKILCNGGYRCEKVQVVDQFIYSTNVETVCLLSKA